MNPISRAAAILAAFSLAACNSTSSTPPAHTSATTQSLVAKAVKHVFVIVQENHTFDNYFGLYPGMNGQTVENLGSATAQADDCVPDPESAGGCQKPFLITSNVASPNYVADVGDISGGDNSRMGQIDSIDGGKMDGFLKDDEGSTATPLPANPTAAEVAAHNEDLVIESTYDCDTIPYLWSYAKNFTLFDHYFQADTGPSTPGNIQLFAGQFGQTEAAQGLGTPATSLAAGGYSDGVPISNDDNPPAPVTAGIPAYSTPDQSTFQSYATMPVLLNPSEDNAATISGVTGLIPDDMALESKASRSSIQWAWYEEGLYTSGAGLIQHHVAPLYFNYINAANSAFGTSSTLRDNTKSNGLITDINNGTLASTGVYWVKGGAKNTYGLTPPDATLASAGQFLGDDDHPGSTNSDHQVAEAYVATLINAIAQSKYWKDSVIILTWDDSGGLYDHYPPPQYGSTCPQDTSGTQAGSTCGDGVRLPMMIISPFSKTGVVVHDASDAGSVSKFIETVFGLPNFASLPDEAKGVADGATTADANSAVSDLTDALDPNKLAGLTAPNSATKAIIQSPTVTPGMSCASLGITPIASPTSLPAGFMTLGGYTHQSLTGGTSIRIPVKNDTDD
jgi:phospholipase C